MLDFIEGANGVSAWIGVGLLAFAYVVTVIVWLVKGSARQDQLFAIATNLTTKMEALTDTLASFRRELSELSIERRLNDVEAELKAQDTRIQSVESRSSDITAEVRKLDPGWSPWRA